LSRGWGDYFLDFRSGDAANANRVEVDYSPAPLLPISISMPADDLVELEIMLNRFNRLMAEVMDGSCRRNSFLPWELEILMDMENCQLERRRRMEILRQYRRAVQRQMEKGPGPPMKLSEFLQMRAARAATMQKRVGKALQ
jgi:hypothetical protein